MQNINILELYMRGNDCVQAETNDGTGIKGYERIVKIVARQFWIYNLDTEDVEQELSIAVWLGLRKFNPNRGANEKTFVERICRNKAIDLWRKGKAEWRMIMGTNDESWPDNKN